MGLDKIKNIEQGNSSDEREVIALVTFIETMLPHFTVSEMYQQRCMGKTIENEYTSALISFLQNEIFLYSLAEPLKENQLFFFFESQAPEEGSRTTDVGVQVLGRDNNGNYIYRIEAKFLPHHDYIIGDYAAIKRFKALQHGKVTSKNLTPLKFSGIVAYVTNYEFEQHLETINNKIIELANNLNPDEYGLTWQSSELLQKQYFNEIAKLDSKHLRIDNTEIILHHFWVKVV